MINHCPLLDGIIDGLQIPQKSIAMLLLPPKIDVEFDFFFSLHSVLLCSLIDPFFCSCPRIYIVQRSVERDAQETTRISLLCIDTDSGDTQQERVVYVGDDSPDLRSSECNVKNSREDNGLTAKIKACVGIHHV